VIRKGEKLSSVLERRLCSWFRGKEDSEEWSVVL